LQYVDEAKRHLKERFNEYGPVRNPTCIYIHTAVSEHFLELSNNHSDTHMRLLIQIEKLKNESASFRKAREAHIIHKAKTLEPIVINKRDEL